MRRRALLAFALSAALSATPLAALAQIGDRLGRPGVDAALVRTVRLVLRAEARGGNLPDFMTDPEPLSPEMMLQIAVGARLDPEFPAELAPARVNRRLPHARSSSVWIVAGTWMAELDPVRMRILSIAPDVLPPEI
jgi:hypothetical protein